MAATSPPPPEKTVLERRRDEFLGILILAAGVLLLAALVSYHPQDPSLFSSVHDPSVHPRNWAGRFGASFSDGALQFFGLAAFVFPLVLLAAGLRRVRARPTRARGTRGVGVLVVLLTAAPLAHLALGRPRLLGGGLGAGGYVGDVLGSLLVGGLNGPGAAILLVSLLLIGL